MNTAAYHFTVTIDGTEYPCALTNGALLQFAETTGHDFGAPAPDSTPVRDNLAIIHACAVSGARREGKQFPYSLVEMADLTTPADLALFAKALERMVSPDADADEKKSPSA